jgi:hypothetical protein
MLTLMTEIVCPDLSAIKARLDKCIQEINVACKGIPVFPIKAKLSEPPIDHYEQELLKELLKNAGWEVSYNDSPGYSKKDWKLYPIGRLIRELYLESPPSTPSYKPTSM